MRLKRLAASGVLALAVVGISACSGAEYGIAALDRDPTSEDQLPDFVLTRDLDVDSVRKVAENDGVSYFIGKMEDVEGFCVYPVIGEKWIGGCGATTTDQIITVDAAAYPEVPQVTLVADAYDTDGLQRDGWVEVQKNVFIR